MPEMYETVSNIYIGIYWLWEIEMWSDNPYAHPGW